MTQLEWDRTGERLYETGIDRVVLYRIVGGVYANAYAWNGVTGFTESPSGAEANAQYADNIKYLNLISAEEFGGTLEAFTYPDAFAECDGSASPVQGITVGQQARKPFGLSYRTRLGNDQLGADYGYKLKLVYNAQAAPSEKAYATMNESPEATPLSWEITTTPVPVPGLKPSAVLTIDSTKVSAAGLAALEAKLYGTAGTNGYLPLPEEVFATFANTVTTVVPVAPAFVASTGVITIPTVTGVIYRRADTNAVVAGGSTVTIPTSGQSLIIRAYPATGGYVLDSRVDDDWSFTRS